MTKLALLAGSLSALVFAGAPLGAQAADLPYRSGGPASVPTFAMYDWTGGYAGLSLGWRAVNFDPVVNSVELEGRTRHSAAVGGHLGYNVQVAPNVVLGLEGDMAWGNNEDKAPGIAGTTVTAGAGGQGTTAVTTTTNSLASKAEIGWNGSLRGRLGYAMDRWLVYGTGGLALADLLIQSQSGTVVTQQIFAPGGALIATNTTSGGTFVGRLDKWALGYTVGAGVEFALTPKLLLRGEYLYAGYGRHTVTVPTGATTSLDVDTHTTRAGISYKF